MPRFVYFFYYHLEFFDLPGVASELMGRRILPVYNHGWPVTTLRSALLLGMTIVAGSADCVAAYAAMNAMDCCVQSRDCAGMRTPEDCCRHMGHGVGASVSTAPTGIHVSFALAPAIVPVIAAPADSGSWSTTTDRSFKRPHDPPHLHPVALLI